MKTHKINTTQLDVNLASVLQTYHTSSMGYRIWHKLNGFLECKTTYCGKTQQLLTYINYAEAVRIDHCIS